MIRATLDTNVLVSALMFGGVPAQILNLHTDEAFLLCISTPILEELERILTERFQWEQQDLQSVLRGILMLAKVVVPSPVSGVSRDSNDDHILACAVAAEADVIVTGDKDLLTLHTFSGIPIITPRQFLTQLESGQSLRPL